MENVLPGRESAADGVDKKSPWEKMHSEPVYGKLIPIGAKTSIHQAIRDKGRFNVEDGTYLDHWRLRRIRAIFRMPLERYLYGLVSRNSLTLICHQKSSLLARKQRKPHKTKAIEMLEECIFF